MFNRLPSDAFRTLVIIRLRCNTIVCCLKSEYVSTPQVVCSSYYIYEICLCDEVHVVFTYQFIVSAYFSYAQLRDHGSVFSPCSISHKICTWFLFTFVLQWLYCKFLVNHCDSFAHSIANDYMQLGNFFTFRLLA